MKTRIIQQDSLAETALISDLRACA